MDCKNLISIIIPVYNNERDIQETINSIRSQTYQNWEAICVDDGSSDNTYSIIRDYSLKDSRIKVIVRDRMPKGGSVCRNIGLSKVKGDYVIFLDGDDVLLPNCLENRLNVITNTDYDFVVFPMSTFRGDLKNSRKITRSDVKDVDYYYMTGSAVWQVTSPIYKTTFIKSICGFDERFSRMQDIELGLRSVVLSRGNFLVETNGEADCFYRMPTGKIAVATLKYLRTLESYGFMLETINKMRQMGYLDNNYKYSLGLLATYCRILQVIDIVKERKEPIGTFDQYNRFDLQPDMLWFHRIILSVLKKICLPVKLHVIIVHLCDQYCRWHFLR